MKKTVITAGMLSVLALSGQALAGSMSPELSVKGQMAIPSCQLEMTGNGVYELGKISNGLISATEHVLIGGGERDHMLTVNCDAATYLNFTTVDNREGTASVAGSKNFGLGNVNGTGKLGYYQLNVAHPTVDGRTHKFYSANKGSTTFKAVSSVAIDKNQVVGWAESDNLQVSGTRFTALLSMKPMLASSKDMGGPISDSVKLDGSSTLNFTYGL